MRQTLKMALGLIALLCVPNAQAFVKITKTYAFPVSKYEQVETAIHDAANRSPADMKNEFTRDLDASDRSLIRCLADSPKLDPANKSGTAGYGCSLSFLTDLGNGATLESTLMLQLTKSAADLKKLLADKSPNDQATLNLGDFFSFAYDSKYSCNAVGTAGAKTWDCYLHVSSLGH